VFHKLFKQVTLACALTAGAANATSVVGAAPDPQKRPGAVVATVDDFTLLTDGGLKVVDDPLALGGKTVRQPCNGATWGIQWRGCFPKPLNPFRWYRLWVRMRADKSGDEGDVASVGVYDPETRRYPEFGDIRRGVRATEVAGDEYRWIDLGRFGTTQGYVYVAPVKGEHLHFLYVDRIVYAPDPDPEPHPDWVNSLKPKGQPGPELTLSTAGETDYAILLSATPTTQEEKAAEDLSRWLNVITDADFSVVREGGDYKPNGKEISIGRTALAAAAELPELKVDLEGGGYAIAVRGETLYLLGGKARGIINAVYCVLEEDLGCRWYTADARRLPRARTLKLAAVPRVYVPVFPDYRDPYYTSALTGAWSLRNRTQSVHKRAGIRKEWGGWHKNAGSIAHTFDGFIPRTVLREHPEYFSEIDGHRVPRQLCLTNSDVQKIVIGKVLEFLKEDPDLRIIDVSPNDGGRVCACTQCKPINDAEGTSMGTLLTFVNAVADAVKDDYPDVRITTLAYLNTNDPPKTIKPRDNVLIWLASDDHNWSTILLYVWETEPFQNALKAWEKLGANVIIWDYPLYHHSFIIPLPNMPVVAENLRFYAKHGVTGVFLQAEHNSTRGSDRELMRSWVWAKQLWDISRDTRDTLRDFTYGFYGKAAEPMNRYDESLWDMWERLHGVGVEKYKELHSGFGKFGYCLMKTPKFIDESSALFKEAEKLAADDKILLSRVELAKLPVLYLEIERGKEDLQGHLKLIDDFDRIGHEHRMTSVRSGLRGPFLDETVEYWRAICVADPEKMSFLEFDNAWRFKPDPDEVGITEKWYAPEVDDKGWAVVRSDKGNGWENQGFPAYLGYGWYRQTFSTPENAEGLENLSMFFTAVDEQAEIYINGKKAFEHTTATTGQAVHFLWTKPFSFDAKPFLKPEGENVLAVRVHNSQGMGGIWKPVYWIWGEQPPSPRVVEDVIKMKRESKGD